MRDRILAELRWTLRALADDVRTVGAGWVIRTRSLPLVWALNQLCVTELPVAGDLLQLADEHQADLPYRHIVVEDEAIGEPFDKLVGAHWEVDREVLMALAEDPDREVDTSAVTELDQVQMLHLMRRWDIEERPGISDDALLQLEEYYRRAGRLWNERCFGILDSHGDPMALTKLRSHNTTAWVEDVYTVPAARGRGYARMLVSHATNLARAAKNSLTFITADDNDWPKHLYAAIGFRRVGETHTLHRDLTSRPESESS